MQPKTIKKIITVITVVLFMLVIPNTSKAAEFCENNRGSIEYIYRAMRRYGESWLYTRPIGVNGYKWEYDGLNANGNGYRGSMIWSTGGGCIGHGKQGSSTKWDPTAQGDGNRKIHVFDIDESDSSKWQYLVYAMLYSTVHNEHSNRETLDSSQVGKQAICNWLVRHQYELGSFKGQIDDGTMNGAYSKNYQKYDRPYGGLNIGGVYYNSASDYVNSSNGGSGISINKTQMNNDTKNGTPTKVFWRDGGSGYTVVGPYRLDIKGKINGATMSFVNSNGGTENATASWYCTSETGALTSISNLTSFSSANKFYLVFSGKKNIKKINSITLRQAKGTIRGRLILSDEGGGGQNFMIFYAQGYNDSTNISLPVPPPTVVVPIKKDKDNGAILTNARFVLKNLDTGKYVVGGLNSMAAPTSWSNTIQGATSYKTGDNIMLDKAGNYQFYEVQAHSRFYKPCNKTEAGKLTVGNTFRMNLGNSISVVLENQPRGFVTIKKVDDTTRKELNNTRFIIKKQNANQYAKGGKGTDPVTWTSNIKEAEIYTPKQEICFEEKILIQLYEVQRESDSYEYCSIDKPLKIGNPIQIKYREVVTATVTNRRKYVKISGYIWEDMPATDKGSQYDNLYNTNVAPDKKVANIKVELKDAAGNILNTRVDGPAVAITKDGTGEYRFKEIEIDRLRGGAYLEFTYNGMSYKSVKLNTNLANGSKATDEAQRNEFNNNFAVITHNQASGGRQPISLSYDRKNYESTLNYEGGIYGYDGQRYPITGVANKYIITANTKSTGFLGQTVFALNDIYTKGIDEMENINLGLVEKEQPDLSLVKDIDHAEVNINGATHVYQYADRFNKDLWGDSGAEGESAYSLSPQVKFGSKYGSMSYTRALYPSDIYYKDENSDKELRVKVTYKIGIRNASNSLISVVNEIDDYYDSKYYNTKDKINLTKQELDQKGNVIATKKLDCDIQTDFNNREYIKIKIKDADLKIQPQSEGYIFIELEVKQDQIIELVGNSETTKLDNIAEISSYSTRDMTGKTYAGIDRDSNPGNATIGQTDTYEDDIDKAPGLQLVLQEARRISGNVFLDSTTGELKTGDIREGDGIYTEGETGIKGVEVRLINLETGQTDQKYNGKDASGEWEEAKVETKEDGSFELSGILPGNYKLVYVWGGQTYTDENGEEQKITVQNYKGTIYQEKDRQNAGVEWYKNKVDTRYSDAMDDYETREKIDNQTMILTNFNQETIRNQDDEIELKDGTRESLITKMDSTTPNLRINLEYDIKETDHKNEYELKDGKIQLDENGFVKKTSSHENYLRNIDFGIVERARQALALDKSVKRAKLVATNGNLLADVTIVTDENGNKKMQEDVNHTLYIPNSDGADGQLKFEVDSEIVQGAKLEVEYGLKVSNISELEYINKEYYLYGSNQGYVKNRNDLVTLKASKIIDYLDNNMAVDDNIESNGNQIIQEVNEKSQLFSQGLLSEQVRSFVNQTNRILLINSLSKELVPIGSGEESLSMEEVVIKGSSLLANNEENLLENNAEIIKIEKTGGASLVTTPGNYIPAKSESEYDDDQSEAVYVVPPTGLAVNYIAYTLLAISCLGILTCGVVLIKKYVLK